jgi:hypothetical protein
VSDDWLEIGEREGERGCKLPAVVPSVPDPAARIRILEKAWAKLSINQRTFLTIYRESRFNERRAVQKLGLSKKTKPMTNWMHDKNFATVVRLWRQAASDEALDKDRLIARQDDIVETLLTPKPILHQGLPTGHTMVEAGAASRANEVLMRAAGLLKDKELEVNIGVVGPSLNIAVVKPDGALLDASPQGVTVDLPEPIDAEWTEA